MREKWFEYIQHVDKFDKKSVIDVSERLDKPSGKHGWLKKELKVYLIL